VVAGIVRRAGGTVRVRTAVGRGTTITVLWPLVDAQAASPAASRAVESGAA
jgi:signal transduction histidine kinase